MAKGKKAAKSKSNKSASKPKVTVQSLHTTLLSVESKLALLGGAPVTFSMRPGNTPKTVQLALQDVNPPEPLTLTSGSPTASSNPRASGTKIRIGIRTEGNPGQNATIDVGNVLPPGTPIVTTVLTGTSALDSQDVVTSS